MATSKSLRVARVRRQNIFLRTSDKQLSKRYGWRFTCDRLRENERQPSKAFSAEPVLLRWVKMGFWNFEGILFPKVYRPLSDDFFGLKFYILRNASYDSITFRSSYWPKIGTGGRFCGEMQVCCRICQKIRIYRRISLQVRVWASDRPKKAPKMTKSWCIP